MVIFISSVPPVTFSVVSSHFFTAQELEKKFQQTAAYRNMKEILTKKNDQIKDLRKRLAKYVVALACVALGSPAG